MEKVLVTGSSGFIGMHLCKNLLESNSVVHGVDNMNSYYDIELKKLRLLKLQKYKNFSFDCINIEDEGSLNNVFKTFKPDKVVNLAAQAGVRHSLSNPDIYINSNINGFLKVLKCCKKYEIQGLIYASSSSVYGGNKMFPFSESAKINKPISIYAVTKQANELMATTYSHLYGINVTGLRFFTVYGPYGRPDMAMYIFAKNIIKNKPITVYNNGNMQRDFTYIDDIISGIKSSLDNNYRNEIFNLGNNKIEKLMNMISLVENSLGVKANIKMDVIQPGDVEKTYADISHAKTKLNYNPKTSIEEGIPKFINWFKRHYKI